MFFREVLNEDHGCAFCVVADGDEAVVLDPKWEVEEYLRATEESGFRVSHVLAVATPGDRPEQTSILVEDTTRSEEPWVVITGNSLFAGDLARPDLAVDPDAPQIGNRTIEGT